MNTQSLTCPNCSTSQAFKMPVNVKNTTTRQQCPKCRKIASIKIQKGTVVAVNKG